MPKAHRNVKNVDLFLKKLFKNTTSSKDSALSLVRLSSKTLPAHENTLSDEADEAGTDNTHRANFDSLGYVLWFSIQNFKTSPPPPEWCFCEALASLEKLA